MIMVNHKIKYKTQKWISTEVSAVFTNKIKVKILNKTEKYMIILNFMSSNTKEA